MVEECGETGIFVNIDPKMPQGDKVAKTRPFQGRAKEGAVWLPERCKTQPEWLWGAEYQIRRFPKGKEKDILDSISLLCHQLAAQWRPHSLDEITSRANNQFHPLDSVIGF